MKIATNLMMTTLLTLTFVAPACATSFNNLSDITSELISRQLTEMRESIIIQASQALESSVRQVGEQIHLAQNMEEHVEKVVMTKNSNIINQPKAE